jgi:hypothetical protein
MSYPLLSLILARGHVSSIQPYIIRKRLLNPDIIFLLTECLSRNYTNIYPNYLERYPPTNKYSLNYESVNGNKQKYGTIKQQYKTRIKKYDFNITDAVEFSKLFLLPDMAHYTKFDLTCDASALLGIIININTFPQNVRIDGCTVLYTCVTTGSTYCLKAGEMTL